LALRAALIAATLAITCLTVRANAAEPGSSLTISLLTMGPGEHPFTKFGHTALWVHDAEGARDEVYNFGTFAFDSPTLVLDSVAGKLPYWLSVQGLAGTIEAYREQGRSLVASELSLTPSQRWALLSALRENALPENRYYRYEYYRDNCSTRVRDALDRVIGGRIAAGSREPVRFTFRDHTLRLVADDPVLYVALDIALGREADAPLTRWEEGFLPETLHQLALHTTVLVAGQPMPLVSRDRTLVAGNGSQTRSAPPNWGLRYLAVGVAAFGYLALLGAFAPKSRAARIALGLSWAAIGLGVGLLGSALGYLALFSAHAAAHQNLNLLLVPPWAFTLLVAGIRVTRGRASGWPLGRTGALLLLAPLLLSLLLKALSHPAQANAQELGFALPLWLGVALSALWGRHTPKIRRA